MRLTFLRIISGALMEITLLPIHLRVSTSFYNCIWLVLNDVIVGAAFGTFLYENSTQLGVLLHSYTSVHLLSFPLHSPDS